MTRRNGYYSLIQYCPDLARMEAANVGVVLFCPEPPFLKVRTAKGNDRIRRFFRPENPDWEQINTIKQSIERRLTVDRDQFRDLASLERFAATRANSMRLTKPRAVLVDDPEAELNRLFDQLVGGTARKGTARIRNTLDRSFAAEGIAPYIRRNVTVTLPVFQRPVKVPYGFRDARFNLIQPVLFRGLSTTGILQKAGRYAIEGYLLYRHRDPALGDLKLIVVGQFGSDQKKVAAAVGEVLQDNKTDLYRTSEIEPLLDVIRATGKPVTGDASR